MARWVFTSREAIDADYIFRIEKPYCCSGEMFTVEVHWVHRKKPETFSFIGKDAGAEAEAFYQAVVGNLSPAIGRPRKPGELI